MDFAAAVEAGWSLGSSTPVWHTQSLFRFGIHSSRLLVLRKALDAGALLLCWVAGEQHLRTVIALLWHLRLHPLQPWLQANQLPPGPLHCLAPKADFAALLTWLLWVEDLQVAPVLLKQRSCCKFLLLPGFQQPLSFCPSGCLRALGRTGCFLSSAVPLKP